MMSAAISRSGPMFEPCTRSRSRRFLTSWRYSVARIRTHRKREAWILGAALGLLWGVPPRRFQRHWAHAREAVRYRSYCRLARTPVPVERAGLWSGCLGGAA